MQLKRVDTDKQPSVQNAVSGLIKRRRWDATQAGHSWPEISNIEARQIFPHKGSHDNNVVKAPLDARERSSCTRERSSCTSSYWDPAFPHVRFHENARGPQPPFWGPKVDVQFPHLWCPNLPNLLDGHVQLKTRISTLIQFSSSSAQNLGSKKIEENTCAYDCKIM